MNLCADCGIKLVECHHCGCCGACCDCIEDTSEDLLVMWDDDIEYEDMTSECKMCGKERILNDEGYCSECWQVWNS